MRQVTVETNVFEPNPVAAAAVGLRRLERIEKPTERLMAVTPDFPILLTATECANLLRVSPKAFYAMVSRDDVPGVTRIGRRLRVRSRDLLDWLDERRAPSPKGEW